MLSYSIEYTENTDGFYQAIADLNFPIMLSSQANDRFDILVAEPFQWLIARDDYITLSDLGGNSQVISGPLHEIINKILPDRQKLPEHVPFCGGAVGLIGYDFAWNKSSRKHKPSEYNCPDGLIGFYDWALVVDHIKRTATLHSAGLHPSTNTLWPRLIKKFTAKDKPDNETFSVSNVEANLSYKQYATCFDAIHSYIEAGDCYQVNLARRLGFNFTGSGFAACKALKSSRARYSAFIKGPDFEVLSFSPERFLKIDYPFVETRPIKGTMPRSSDPLKDFQLKEALLNSEKDRAENVMIVDLLRNDLSKVSKAFSVAVSKLFDIESLPAVHHMVSTITGEIKHGLSPVDVLFSCFPGGSITGAPKLRAMEIIDELEPNRRGPYCGSIFYMGWDWKMDSNIAIRTLLREGDKLYCWSGGGIVYDSILESEYSEMNAKISLIIKCLNSRLPE